LIGRPNGSEGGDIRWRDSGHTDLNPNWMELAASTALTPLFALGCANPSEKSVSLLTVAEQMASGAVLQLSQSGKEVTS